MPGRSYESRVIRPEGLATITMPFSYPALATVISSFPQPANTNRALLIDELICERDPP